MREGEENSVPEQDKLDRFEDTVLPHLGAAYNLARWLVRNDQDAEDVVQEAYLRALKFFGGFRGGDSRSWLLTIVRNACFTWLHENRLQEQSTVFDEELHGIDGGASNSETTLLRSADIQTLRQALEQLPVEFREVVIMRELEGLSYKEIGDIAGVPLGTVMSRLARGRKQLQQCLLDGTGKGARNEL